MDENNIEKKMTRSPMKESIGNTCEDKCTNEEYMIDQSRAIIGWEGIEDVAKSIWSSIHSKLLEGDLVFAYKTGNQGDRLKQIVIVRNFEWIYLPDGQRGKNYTDFAVGYITSGYTALLPHVPLRYISDEIQDNLKEWKVPKDILGTYKAIIEDLEKEDKNGK